MSYASIFAPGLFAGKVVVVTGGGSGIGRCVARELAALGARVALVGRKPEKLQKVADEIAHDCGASGGSASTHVCDIRQEDAVRNTVAAIVAQHGAIEIGRAPGVIQVTFLAPLSRLDAVGLGKYAREQYNL